MSSQPVNCCSKPVYSNHTIEISRKEVALLVMSVALIIIGSLWVAGVFSQGGSAGVILPFANFGAAVEGGICIALGGITIPIILGRAFSPRFRNLCSDPKND